jgi:hypothetical protein
MPRKCRLKKMRKLCFWTQKVPDWFGLNPEALDKCLTKCLWIVNRKIVEMDHDSSFMRFLLYTECTIHSLSVRENCSPLSLVSLMNDNSFPVKKKRQFGGWCFVSLWDVTSSIATVSISAGDQSKGFQKQIIPSLRYRQNILFRQRILENELPRNAYFQICSHSLSD